MPDNLVDVDIWTREGRLEAPFLKEINVGLEARVLIVAVGDDLDLGEVLGRHAGEWK